MVAVERSLAEWLAWMEAHHPRQIELGLARIADVADRLGLRHPKPPVITVGGTNGKGSCVAFLEAILRAQGYRVGAYTSPHLLRYNERVRIDGHAVDDTALCAAFSAIHAALGDTSLTYFEFGTLAALWLFQREPQDVLVLEVGLGGRLDAVNLIDADVAVLTTIDLDHQDWLGDDRETIGAEKAGIFRPGKAAICADPAPPESVAAAARRLGAHWLPIGAAFTVEIEAEGWNWRAPALPEQPAYRQLPLPALPLPSAAAALTALHCLPLPVTEAAVRQGLQQARLAGRFQRLSRSGVEIVLDVAHNPQAAGWLAKRLAENPQQPTAALFAVMADKDLAGIVTPLRDRFTRWFIGDLPGNPRALPAAELEVRLRELGIDAVARAATLGAALDTALATLGAGQRLVVFGSFFTVAEALGRLAPHAAAPAVETNR